MRVPVRADRRGHLRGEGGPVGERDLTGEDRRGGDLAGLRVVRGALGRAAVRLGAEVGPPAAVGHPQRVEHGQARRRPAPTRTASTRRGDPLGWAVADDGGGLGVLPVRSRRPGVAAGRAGSVPGSGRSARAAKTIRRPRSATTTTLSAGWKPSRYGTAAIRSAGERTVSRGRSVEFMPGACGAAGEPSQPLWMTRGLSTDTESIDPGAASTGVRSCATRHTAVSWAAATLR